MENPLETFIKLFNSNNPSNDTKNLIFKVCVISVLLYFFFTYIFENQTTNVIILIIFILFVIYIYIYYTSSNVSDKNKMILYHLNTLQEITNKYLDSKIKNAKLTKKEINDIYEKNSLNSMYIDSNLIEFLYSIKQLSEWNIGEFYLLLKGVNNILKIRDEIEEYEKRSMDNIYPDNIDQMFEQTLELRTNTINNMHRFIYSIPKTNMMYNYVNNIIEKYQILISRNTDIIYEYTLQNKKKKAVSNETHYTIYNTIKPYDDYNKMDFYI